MDIIKTLEQLNSMYSSNFLKNLKNIKSNPQIIDKVQKYLQALEYSYYLIWRFGFNIEKVRLVQKEILECLNHSIYLNCLGLHKSAFLQLRLSIEMTLQIFFYMTNMPLYSDYCKWLDSKKNTKAKGYIVNKALKRSIIINEINEKIPIIQDLNNIFRDTSDFVHNKGSNKFFNQMNEELNNNNFWEYFFKTIRVNTILNLLIDPSSLTGTRPLFTTAFPDDMEKIKELQKDSPELNFREVIVETVDISDRYERNQNLVSSFLKKLNPAVSTTEIKLLKNINMVNLHLKREFEEIFDALRFITKALKEEITQKQEIKKFHECRKKLISFSDLKLKDKNLIPKILFEENYKDIFSFVQNKEKGKNTSDTSNILQKFKTHDKIYTKNVLRV